MKISSSLLKPYLSQLQNEFEQLFQTIGFDGDLEAIELKSDIQKHLQTLAKLKAAVMVLEDNQETLVPYELHTAYKQQRLELRFAKRTWERLLSNQERIRKMQKRRDHVATFAA